MNLPLPSKKAIITRCTKWKEVNLIFTGSPIAQFPQAGEGNYHQGLDALLNLMSDNGTKLYKTDKDTDLGGKDGLIDKEDVVLIKVNAQWKFRGCTNSDVIRGLIARILEHPDGFLGEIVIFENGQGGGSLDCDTMWGGRYPDTGVHANAEDESHSFSYLVDKVFADLSACEPAQAGINGHKVTLDESKINIITKQVEL